MRTRPSRTEAQRVVVGLSYTPADTELDTGRR